MIASLRGELQIKTPDKLIIDVNGIGYEVYFCRAGIQQLPEVGQEVFLHTYLNVREDALDLYGFVSVEEKEMFIVLLQVSGIGPKVALNMLSAISPHDLAMAIVSEDLLRLTKLPGIGKKTAERLCLELKEKVVVFGQHGESYESFEPSVDSVSQDVISALVNLGYPQAKAREALHRIKAQHKEEWPLELEELLRLSLRSLA